MRFPTASSRYTPVIAAEAASNFGSMLSRLAIPWLATLLLQATPWQMGLLLVADVAAGAVGALLLGPLVDSAGKRRVMLLCDGLRAVLLALLAAAAAVGSLTMAALLLAGAAAALFTTAFELARSAWMAQHIAAAELSTANARLSAAGSLSETLAFALGGWLFELWGAVLALLFDAASYLVSALCLRRVVDVAPAAPASPSATALLADWWASTRDGWLAVAGNPTLRTLALIESLSALAMSLVGTSYMIFVARDLGFSTGVQGVIFATGGVGALAGAMLAPGLGRRLGSGRALALGLALSALGTAFAPMATSASVLGAVLLVAQQVVGDGGHTLREVHQHTLRQLQAPPDMLARVDAGIRACGQAAVLLGALGGGALATAIGARSALVLGAALLAAAALVALLRLPRG